jgi:hypothetical protein
MVGSIIGPTELPPTNPAGTRQFSLLLMTSSASQALDATNTNTNTKLNCLVPTSWAATCGGVHHLKCRQPTLLVLDNPA